MQHPDASSDSNEREDERWNKVGVRWTPFDPLKHVVLRYIHNWWEGVLKTTLEHSGRSARKHLLKRVQSELVKGENRTSQGHVDVTMRA